MFWKGVECGGKSIYLGGLCKSISMVSQVTLTLGITQKRGNMKWGNMKMMGAFLGTRTHAPTDKIVHAILNCTPRDLRLIEEPQVFNKTCKNHHYLTFSIKLHHVSLSSTPSQPNPASWSSSRALQAAPCLSAPASSMHTSPRLSVRWSPKSAHLSRLLCFKALESLN